MLSVIIPHYNEKSLVETLLQKVIEVPLEKEIILVDDGSSPEAVFFLKNKVEKSFPGLRVVYHEKNLGKGSAIRTGLKEALGDLVIIQDADLEYDPRDYLEIVKKFSDPKVQVVYGTRFSKINRRLFVWHWFCNRFFGGHYEIRYLHHFLGIQVLNLLANLLYSAKITDEATCYKAFRKKALDQIELQCHGFEFCPEVTAKIKKAGYDIVEVPISYHPRSHKEGKKLNWRHGFEAIATLIKYRFVD
jgi:dolichol-phosphate mannosyltransferase